MAAVDDDDLRPPTPPQAGQAATSGEVDLAGGVLSDGEIESRVKEGKLIVEGTFEPACLQPASYDLKIARDGALLDGGQYPLGSRDQPAKALLPLRIRLEPGQAAMFSTTAKFGMPPDVAGNITIKNSLATKGLMLLSGLLIDPGYGLDEPVDGERGCRLYLHVANIGKDRIDVFPGVEAIARVQFLSVYGGVHKDRPKVPSSTWIAQTQPSLGFLTEMKALQEEVRSTNTTVQNVVMLGFVVLGITLIGVSLSTILTLSLNTTLVHELRTVWPHTGSGKAVLAALLVLPLSLWALFAILREAARGVRWLRRERRRRAVT
jgi:deoxycytidine triphosphate deaminase